MTSSPAGKEFLPFPENYEDLIADVGKDNTIKLPKTKGATTMFLLTNNGKFTVLYKVKCSNNKRIAILDCADVLMPGKTAEVHLKRKKVDTTAGDQLCVIYTLLGENGGTNAFVEWRRATEQQVPTKSITLKLEE